MELPPPFFREMQEIEVKITVKLKVYAYVLPPLPSPHLTD